MESVWRNKYKTLKEYYENEFDSTYFTFDKYQLTIDPDETLEEINKYDVARQEQEYKICRKSFYYFAQKYIKILHSQKGLIPFLLFNYQKRVIHDYEKHRFNIISKFRQGGLTTVTEMWGLWKCIFKLDQQIMFISKTDREAIAAGTIVNKAYDHLPDWVKHNNTSGKWNDHEKQFAETGGSIFFLPPEGARGRTVALLIIDEAAFIPNMEEHWKAMYPTLSTGGNCIVISTVHGLGNWYAETYNQAKEKKNKFHVIELDYWEHPEYNNEEWVRDQKAQLREKGWLQEVLRSFIGTGETYISGDIITYLLNFTKDNYPLRKRFQNYVNTGDENEDWTNDGALWIWKEPEEGREYILGIDSAEGVGDIGDNSCIQVIEANKLEQVAEFYSNNVNPYVFAQIVNQIGIYYNTGLVVVENMSTGSAVLAVLQNELAYENIYFGDVGRSKTPKPGIHVSMSNRPVILQNLQQRLTNNTLTVNSKRLVKELTTFVYNPKTKKAEAENGRHDDAIMAMCHAVYIRDNTFRATPVLMDSHKEVDNPFVTAVYDEIRREIMEGTEKDIVEISNDIFAIEDDPTVGVVFDFRRKNNTLLKEFMW